MIPRGDSAPAPPQNAADAEELDLASDPEWQPEAAMPGIVVWFSQTSNQDWNTFDNIPVDSTFIKPLF